MYETSLKFYTLVLYEMFDTLDTRRMISITQFG